MLNYPQDAMGKSNQKTIFFFFNIRGSLNSTSVFNLINLNYELSFFYVRHAPLLKKRKLLSEECIYYYALQLN